MKTTGHDPDCACCGQGRGKAAMIDDEDRNISEYGFQYILVFGGGGEPGFIYTSGLAEKGLPEFIFIGSSEPKSHMYIASFIEHAMQHGDMPIGLVPPSGDQGPNPFQVPAWVLPRNDRLKTHAFGVEARLNRIGSKMRPRLLQVVMPDLLGRFPWEDGYEWMNQLVHKEPRT